MFQPLLDDMNPAQHANHEQRTADREDPSLQGYGDAEGSHRPDRRGGREAMHLVDLLRGVDVPGAEKAGDNSDRYFVLMTQNSNKLIEIRSLKIRE